MAEVKMQLAECTTDAIQLHVPRTSLIHLPGFDDLASRFLLNLPFTETASLPRFCFQVEEAQWYYEDFVRPLAASAGQQLPALNLRQFSLLMFQHCPLWNDYDDVKLAAAYDLFLEYKVRVPVRGAIMLDESMEKVVLVKGYKKGANWSFPRGKINLDEDDLDCAIREVYEETGFDVRAAGLVPRDRTQAKHIDITMREQHMRMFVFRGVPLDTYFEPQTRKEISKVEFYTLRDLPGYRKKHKDAEHDHEHEVHQANKFYMVAPFLGPLKKWIGQQRRASGYVSTDVNHSEATGLAGEDTDDGFAYHIPEVSNEEKSEALKKMLSIGAFAPSDLPPALSNHAAYAQSGLTAQSTQQYPSNPIQHSSQQNALLSILRSPSRDVPKQPVTAHQQSFPVQHPHPGLARPSMTTPFGQPFELPAMMPQDLHRTTHNIPQPAFNALQPAAPHQMPNVQELAPPKRMLLQLLSVPSTSKRDTSEAGIDPARKTTEQASKLLDLLKSPVNGPAQVSAVPTKPQAAEPPNESIVHHEKHVRPAGQTPTQPQQRSSTINEFTRTLPSRTKKASHHTGAPSGQNSTSTTMPRSTNTKSHVVAATPDVQPRILQREHAHTSRQEVTNLKAAGAASPTISTSAANKNTAKTRTKLEAKRQHKIANADAAPTPTFKILTRPESQHPFVDTTAHQTGVQHETSNGAEGSQAQSKPADASDGKQPDKLLALFGSKPAGNPAATTRTAQDDQDNKGGQNHLLKLFEKSSSAVLPSKDGGSVLSTEFSTSQSNVKDTAIPNAPHLQPEQRPSKLATTLENPLLNLFKNTGLHRSPETPISPFVLGSPEILRRPQLSDASTQHASEAANVLAAKQNNVTTPAESKNFLLDYLNGVVQSEGHRK